MEYIYTKYNRLKDPHAYMYADYAGEEFLRSYLKDRVDRMRSQLHLELPYRQNEKEPGDATTELCKKSITIVREMKQEVGPIPETFSIENRIVSLDLFVMLLDALSTKNIDAQTAIWMNRLIQRFEVSKKLYDAYQPGFKKGEGAAEDIRLYEYFALALTFSYFQFGNIQYLSTLLKVVDLLLSIPGHQIGKGVGKDVIASIVLLELNAVQLLARDKGVSFRVE